MPRGVPLIGSFNAGELSPLLEGRVDLEKYQAGLRRCENFLVKLQGPLERRGGTRYVASVKNHANRVWLGRFEFSTDEAYVLEIGPLYFRFFTQRGQLLNGGSPFEVVHTYDAGDLTRADGTFGLQYVQSGDVLYFVGGNDYPRQLNRLGATNWTWTHFDYFNGPWKEWNDQDGVTVYASAATGTGITLTASSAIFTAGHIDGYFMLENLTKAVTAWEPAKAVTAGNHRYSDGKVYEALNSATTGSVKPTHSQGTVSDGAVDWAFLHAGYGHVLITAVASGTSATADVLSRLPAEVVGSGNATNRWRFGAWSVAEGFPSAIGFFRERLVFARGRTLWFSKVGEYADFADRVANEVLPESAITLNISSGKVDQIRWLQGADVLYVGTTGGLVMVRELTSQEPFGPENATPVPGPDVRCASMRPVTTATAKALFLERSRRRLRELSYSLEQDAVTTPDQTRLAEHVLRARVRDMAYTSEPDSIVWCALEDGQLAAFTYDREQEVYGWSRHGIGGRRGGAGGGPAEVEAVQAIPSPDASRDDLWLIVARNINGSIVRYVEYLEGPFEPPAPKAGELERHYRARVRLAQPWAFYVDSGLTLDKRINATLTIPAGADVLHSTVTFTAGSSVFTGQEGQAISYEYVIEVEPWRFERRRGVALILSVLSGTQVSARIVKPWHFPETLPALAWRMTASSVSGLGHLEGQTVAILGDGAIQPPKTVVGGAVAISPPAAIVHVGLPYESVLETMRPEFGSPDGTSQGRTKRTHKMVARLLNAAGGRVGSGDEQLDAIRETTFRHPSTPMDEPTPLFSGDAEQVAAGGYNKHGRVVIRHAEPTPFTVAALMPHTWVTEG